MTGDGIVLRTEDSAAIAGLFSDMMTEFAPRTRMGSVLIKRSAILAVRLDRSYEQETANINTRVGSAESDLIDRRKAEAEHLLLKITHEPVTNRRRLLATPEGVDLLIAKWRALKADLDQADVSLWSYNHQVMADAMNGREAGVVDVSEYMGWSNAAFGNFEYIAPRHFQGLADDQAKKTYALDRLADLIDADIAKLQAHRETLDLSAIEAERSFAAKRALFDSSKEAILARKYEATAARELYRALKEFRQIEAECETRFATASVIEISDEVASFVPEAADEPEPTDEPDQPDDAPDRQTAQTPKSLAKPALMRTIRPSRRIVVDKPGRDVANR